MRPAQIAREIWRTHPNQVHTRYASMRPAQIAREIQGMPPASLLDHRASMRPAQIAREIHCHGVCSIQSKGLQ